MSQLVYFLENKSRGPQIAAEVLDTLQSTEKLLERAFICATGDNVILCGVVNNSGVYTDGLIIWDGELYYFEGGSFGNYIVVNEQTTECTFCSGDRYRIFTIRTAKFSNTVAPGQPNLPVTPDIPELFHLEYTLVELNQEITNIYNEIENLTNDVNEQITDIIQTNENQQNQIDYLTSLVQQLQTAVINLTSRINECCEPAPTLDVDFSDSTIDLCFQNSNPGKLFGTLHLVGSGTDFDSFDGTIMATIYVSDAPGDKYKYVSYSPAKTGLNPTFDIQLLLDMGNTIDTPVGMNTRTITFTVRFKDNSDVIHFVNIKANIPQMVGESCSNGLSTTFTVEDF